MHRRAGAMMLPGADDFSAEAGKISAGYRG